MCTNIEFEEVNCLICGRGDAAPSDSIRWRESDLHYVICTSCGLKYIRPRPTQRWYSQFYGEDFWQEKVTNQGFSINGNRPVLEQEEGLDQRLAKQQRRARRIYSLVSPEVPLSPESTVLEIGAAFGEALHLLRERYQCRVLGVEPSRLSRTYASETNGVELVGHYMEDLAGPQPFDGQVNLLIMSHVLENIVDPLAALSSARRLLAVDGFLYIDTSNFYYYNAVNPYHPYLFNPETLSALLGRSGFQVVKQICEPHPREARRPTDPYLAVIAQSGPFVSHWNEVDVESLVADQRLGLTLIDAAQQTPAFVKLYRRMRKSLAGFRPANAAVGTSSAQK